jgi:hypothetical protein
MISHEPPFIGAFTTIQFSGGCRFTTIHFFNGFRQKA